MPRVSHLWETANSAYSDNIRCLFYVAPYAESTRQTKFAVVRIRVSESCRRIPACGKRQIPHIRQQFGGNKVGAIINRPPAQKSSHKSQTALSPPLGEDVKSSVFPRRFDGRGLLRLQSKTKKVANLSFRTDLQPFFNFLRP